MRTINFLDDEYSVRLFAMPDEDIDELFQFLRLFQFQYISGEPIRTRSDLHREHKYMVFRNGNGIIRRIYNTEDSLIVTPAEMLVILSEAMPNTFADTSWLDELTEKHEQGGNVMERRLDFLDKDYSVDISSLNRNQYFDLLSLLENKGIVWNGGRTPTTLNTNNEYINSLKFRKWEQGMMHSSQSYSDDDEFYIYPGDFLNVLEDLLKNKRIDLTNVKSNLLDHIHNNIITRFKTVIEINSGKSYVVNTETKARYFSVGIEQEGDTLLISFDYSGDIRFPCFEFINENNREFNEKEFQPMEVALDVFEFDYVIDSVDGVLHTLHLPMKKSFVPTYIKDFNINQLRSHKAEIKGRDLRMYDDLLPKIHKSIVEFLEAHNIKAEDIKEIKLKEIS